MPGVLVRNKHVAQISGDPEVQLRAQALLKQILMTQNAKK